MSYATITVPEFDPATALNLTDHLWLTQGLGVDRNKKLTLELLKDYFLDFVADQRIGYLEGYFKNDIPSVFGDRTILLIGQVIEIIDYQKFCDAMYCGDANNATAATFYKTSDAGGTTRSTSGTYMVLPDARGLSWKGIGDAIINGRTKTGPDELGEMQEDQGQAWQLGCEKDTTGARDYWATSGLRDYRINPIVDTNFTYFLAKATAQGSALMFHAKNDGTNGDPRQGLNTRDSTIGTNWGMGY